MTNTTLKNPAEIFELGKKNPTGLVFTRELLMWGFITKEHFAQLRGQYLTERFLGINPMKAKFNSDVNKLKRVA